MLKSKISKVLAAIGVIASAVFAQNDGDTKIITARGTSIEVVFVGAGSFIMGDHNQAQQVTLTQDFWISKYPITQAQYQAVMGNNPSSNLGNSHNPVEMVTWQNAITFATLVGGRLLTEAEWEFAALGGNKSQGFIYSGSNDINEVAWWQGNSVRTQPVGQKKANELGIHDMSGNVWEWVNDWWSSNYSNVPVTNPTGPDSGSFRVVRGGSTSHIISGEGRIAERRGFLPLNRYEFIGLRVAFPADNGTSISKTISRKSPNFAFAGINNGQINIRLQAGNYTAELYNLQGRLIGKTEINATNGINATGLRTDNLSRGVFILNVKQAGNSVLRHKISVR